jgi:HEAT repeat protein
MTRNKIIFLSVLVCCLLGVALILGLLRNLASNEQSPESAVSDKGTPENPAGGSVAMDTAFVPVLDEDSVEGYVPSGRVWSEEEAQDSELSRLQDILDTNVNEDILAQAEFLVNSDSAVRRHGVIPALQWVGTPAAMRLLIPLLNDSDPDVAHEAQLALEGIMDSMMNQVTTDDEGNLEVQDEEEVSLDELYDVYRDAIMATEDEDACDVLMLKLSTMEVQFSLPVLVEILETGADWQKALALEYMDSVTHGDGVTNREEAVTWLQKANNTQRVDEE